MAGDFPLPCSCSGDDYHTEYTSYVQPDGLIELVESGKTCIQDEINSHLSECDYHDILDRLRLGDYSQTKKPAVDYGDFTSLPETFQELAELSGKMQTAFSAVPPDVKERYNFSLKEWLAAAGSVEWMSLMFPPEELPQTLDEPIVKDVIE